MKRTPLFVSIAAAALLAACGGGGGRPAASADPDAVAEMPASAGASVQAFQDALAGLASDERANPLGLEQMLPPTSETAEPLALD